MKTLSTVSNKKFSNFFKKKSVAKGTLDPNIEYLCKIICPDYCSYEQIQLRGKLTAVKYYFGTELVSSTIVFKKLPGVGELLLSF